MKQKLGWLLFGCLLVVPRLLRFLWPQVQVEDPNYIYGAFLLTKGLIPFAEFAQVNPPLLESIMAVLYRIFGVSYRIPEALSMIAYIISSLLVFSIGNRVMNRTAGVVASLAYAWHFLLFRYHVFERETFATLGILLGIDFLTRKKTNPWTPVVAGMIMGFGFMAKQTALIPFAAIVAYMALCRWEWKRSLLLCLGFGAFTGLMSLGYTLAFGKIYWDQIFWFHWIKGFVAPWYIKAFWSLGAIGYLLPLSIAGFAALKNIRTDWTWAWPVLITADLVFFWIVSGAFWPHYLLSTIPFLALMAGAAAGLISKTHKHRMIVMMFLFAVGIAAIQIHDPAVLIGKGAADNFGFSGIPRQDVETAAQTIRDNTSESDLIISDPFIALESQRIKVVRFKDNWGLILWMNRMMDEGKYQQAVKELSKKRFGEVRRQSHMYWMPLIDTAFAENKVGAVQPNYELPLNPARLQHESLKLRLQNEHYTIWTR